MRIVLLFILLLPSILCTAFGSTSAVVTSKDVREGLTSSKMQLIPGADYRVYAVYSSSASNNDYASNVIIKGQKGGPFNVAALATAKSNGALDETNILTAPITVSDNNIAAPSAQVPYTIYIVSAKYQVAPVYNVMPSRGQVDSGASNLVSPSCTIISADPSFELSKMESTSVDPIAVKVVGFDFVDATNDDYTVMKVTKYAAGSSVMISGPIATLHNTNAGAANFTFSLSRTGSWSGNISPRASTAFLSNGWLTMWESYNVDGRTDGVLQRSYDYGRDAEISFWASVGQQAGRESVEFVCTRNDGSSLKYNLTQFSGDTEIWCRYVKLNVDSANLKLAFKVTIESGTLSNSIFVLLIATFVLNLIQ